MVTLVRGVGWGGGMQAVQGGLSCTPPPTPPRIWVKQCHTSVNSYCIIILEYLVVRDVNIISVKLRCLHRLSLSEGWGASCPGWFILPPAQDSGQSVSLVNSYCTIILEYLVVRDVKLTSNIQFGYPCPKAGGKAVQAGKSCPHAQDLGQTVSSVNSYCTIILEYLVVQDINIISVKLKRLHPKFSLVILVQGVGGSCPGWFILSPPPSTPPPRIWVRQ